MGGGILSGLIWGTLVSVVSLVVASLLAPLPREEPGDTRPVARLSVPQTDSAPQQTETTPPSTVAAETPSNDAVTSVISVPAGSEFRREMPDTEPSLPGGDAVSGAGTAPRITAPSASGTSGTPQVDTTAGARPETVTAIGASPTAPQVEDSGVQLAPPVQTEAEQGAMGPKAPAIPQSDSSPSSGVEVAALPVSRPEAVDSAVSVATVASDTTKPEPQQPVAVAPAPEAEVAGTVEPESAPESDAVAGQAETETAEPAPTPSATSVTALNDSPTASIKEAEPEKLAAAVPEEETVAALDNAEAVVAEAADSVDASEPTAVVASDGDVADAPAVSPEGADVISGAELAAETAQEADTGPANAAVEVATATPQPQPEVVLGIEQPQGSETVTVDGAPAVSDRAPGSGGLGVRVIPLTERNKGGARLPSIGQPAPEAEPVTVAVDTGTEAPQLTALARNAAPFDNPGSKPLFSIILIDDGQSELSRDVLTAFSFPVSFAIDPTRADSAAAAAAYRRAGFEVVMLAAGLPEGARPQDVEVTLGSHLAAIDNAVAVMDLQSGGFSGSRELTAQVLDLIRDQGHGLVTWDSGLNAPKKAADKVGHPAALAFRELDGDGENAATMRRYLDRAVFKASQDGHVVMVGHAKADTVTALYEWALSGKASQVALAPVSAVLRAQ